MATQDDKKRGLKKIVRRERVRIGTGDGGAFSQKTLIVIGKQPTDSSFVVKDSLIVLPPKEKRK